MPMTATVIRRPPTRRVVWAALAGTLVFVCTLSRSALADEILASPAVVPVPQARDVPFPGTIKLHVDATDVIRGIFSVDETIPVEPGHLALLIPKWQQGAHSIQLPVTDIAGLEIKASGKPLAWRRDPAEVYAFNIDVPAGVSSLDVSFKFLSPTAPNQGRVMMTPQTLQLEWSSLILYPAGYHAYDIKFSPTVVYPQGWTSVTSLIAHPERKETVQYPVTDLDTLIDSPVMAGAHAETIDLDGHAKMDIFWDEETAGKVAEARVTCYRNLVDQALKLFGHANYSRYDFLIKATGGDGQTLEHRRSAELSLPLTYLTEAPPAVDTDFDKIAHEYTHSWNGKSRRPYDLWQPEFSTPQRGSLLWVYEGLTEYWGAVLGARSSCGSRQTALDFLAEIAAGQTQEAGRNWRNLLDTTTDNAAPVRRRFPWRSYQRPEDFYFEGVLVWLDADQIIRTQSQGQKSLDDFAKAFFPLQEPEDRVGTYDFNDVLAALQKVQPYDWRQFFIHHLVDLAPNITGGIERSGYRLVYTGTPSAFSSAVDEQGRYYDEGARRNLSYSIGATVKESGAIYDVIWGGPAFDAGLTVGSTVKTVNGQPFTLDALIAAVRFAASGTGTVTLGTVTLGFPRQVEIKWSGGLRYPHLERNGSPPLLDAILSPIG